MGTPEFGCPTLKQLIADHDVRAVFTNPPKPIGRGQKLQETPIHRLANLHNIEVFTPSSLKTSDTYNIVESISADIIIVCAYGFLVPQNILQAKKYGCINLHPSKLPRWRGASPLQHTIISGDIDTSVCIMKMDEGLDTGPILRQFNFTLPERVSFEWLHNYTANIGALMVSEVVYNIEHIVPVSQNVEGATYAHKLSREDAVINWHMPANLIDCKIRGQIRWPGSVMHTDIGPIKILEAIEALNETHLEPGHIIDPKNLTISCGENTALTILKLQAPGKNPMNTKEFVNGYSINLINAPS
ncbi:MAG: methionyl-tRNA formyltransferase [Alphaproteobacteria bacterium]|nr:methionyl-tRNA formyltransferase [Alphaproteobacteria bacterium]